MNITFESITICYDKNTILKNVSFAIGENEYWTFWGENGAGKTSLIHCLLGIIKPTSGTINIQDCERSQIGFVPQLCMLNSHLPTTVAEFVSLGLVNVKLPKHDRIARLHSVVETAGIQDEINSNFWQLSGGEKQRALIARALIMQPKLIILDEPTVGLDQSSEHSFLTLIQSLQINNNVTIVMVTHDKIVAQQYATHYAVFHDGTVTASDKNNALHIVDKNSVETI